MIMKACVYIFIKGTVERDHPRSLAKKKKQNSEEILILLAP